MMTRLGTSTRLARQMLPLALLSLLVASLCGGVAFTLMASHQDRLRAILRSDTYTLLGATDATAQLRAYGIFLLVLPAIGGLVFLRRGRVALPYIRRGAVRGLEVILAGVILTVTLFWVNSLQPSSEVGGVYWGGHSITAMPTIGWPEAERSLAIGVVVLAAILMLWAYTPRRWLPRLALGAALLDCLMLTLPGLLAPFRMEGVDFSEWIILNAHYGFLLGDNLQLRAGLPFVDLVDPYYGFLMPVLVAMGEQAFGAMDMAHTMRLVQLSQVVFLTIYGGALLVQSRGAWFGVAVALLLVAPWMSTVHFFIFYPNQTGYRYIGFALSLLAMSWLTRREVMGKPVPLAPWWLGGVTGLAILINYDTGAVVGVGAGLFLLLRLPFHAGWPAYLSLVLRFVAGLLMVHAAFWLLVFWGVGQGPKPLAGLFWPLFSADGEASIGLPLRVDSWIAVMAGFVAVAVVRVIVTSRFRAVGPDAALLAAVGTMFLLWLTYWVSRSAFFCDWSAFVLFGPFIVELMRPVNLSRYTALACRFRPAPGALVLALVVLPAAFVSQRRILPEALEVSASLAAPTRPAGRLVSGVWFRPDVGAFFEAKATGIRVAAGQGSVIYISANSFLLAILADHPLPLRTRELVFGLKTQQNFDDYVQQVLTASPDRILIDDDTAPVEMFKSIRHTLDEVQQALGGRYTQVSDTNGWRVLERRSPD